MTPIPLAVALVGGTAGRLADRHSAGLLCGVGLLLMAAGIAALALMPARPDTVAVVWREAVVGLGFGLFQAPNNRMILSSGPRNRAASAGGMLATARLLGQSLGAAVVAVVFEISGAAATAVVLTCACVLALMGAAISFLRLSPRV